MAEERDRDALFLEIARERGLLDEAGERLCRETQAALTKVGYSRSMARIAGEKGLLTAEQVSEIRRQMQRRGVLPRIGNYELLAKLGQGGMGTVYKARQLSLDRVVALKVLSRELAADKKYVERFRREGLIAARIVHPNAVQIYDVGDDRGQQFIAMEYIDGASADRLLASGPVDERRALAIIRGVAAALAVAHELGIVHRDIKPANILLTRDGEPKLADLGIARQAAEGMHTLTTAGVAVGTPQYMSPEQCRGDRSIDGRSDIYSLGATLFHFVCGRPPFEGGIAQAIMYQHVHDPLPDPGGVNPALSAGAAVLIQRMMAKDRDGRPATCAEVIADVNSVVAGGTPAGSRADSPAVSPIPADRPRTPAGAPVSATPLTTPTAPVARVPEPVATPTPMPSPAREFSWLAVVVGVLVLGAIGLIGTTVVMVTARRTDSIEARHQRALAERFAGKATEAKGLLSQGKWSEAIAALAEAKALGGQLQTRPTTYDEIDSGMAAARAALKQQADEAQAALLATYEAQAKKRAAEGQTALLASYEAEEKKASEMEAAGKWAEAVAALAQAQALGGELETKSASYGGLAARLTKAMDSLRASGVAAAPPTATPASTAWSFDAAEANRRQKEAEKVVTLPAGWTSQKRTVTAATPRGDQPADITFHKNTIGMPFVVVPAGEFEMGSPAGEAARSNDEGPQHKATLTKAFMLGATEVTQAQWQAVMGSNPSNFKGADNPVENVSWDDCQEFLKKLCAKEGVAAGTYRLPTEAEWEYACRAGTATRFYSGDADSALDAVGWYDRYSGRTTHPVGGKKPNAWGLYDMHGNVWEWCQDWYGNYAAGDATDPTGPATGQWRVLRGGSWNSDPLYCRSAFRDWFLPAGRGSNGGFRLVVVVSPRPSNP